MNARRGAALAEVVIAIFVMAIGMISLLVLFPVGIQNIASSAHDNRVAVAAANAQALAEHQNVRSDEWVVGFPGTNPPASQLRPGSMHDFIRANPTIRTPVFNVNYTGPGTPVLVDPIGNAVYGTGPIGVIGSSRGIPRARVSFAAPTSNQPQRWFVLHDDINFNLDGVPTSVTPNVVERDRKYSWAYLWRRPRYSDPNVAELSVVIFSGRKLRAGGAGSSGERTIFFTNFTKPIFDPSGVTTGSATTAVIPFNANNPIKRGFWILDATVMPVAPQGYTPPTGFQPPYYNGYFYRIVDVADPVGNEQRLELDRPARGIGFVGVMIPNIADVIEKSDGRMPN